MNKKDPNNHKLDKELQECLRFLVSKYEREDPWIRKNQIKIWKKHEEFWHGIQFTFWNEARQEWISPAETTWFQSDEGREGAEGPFYDYVVNIYRAHGESIIAALSAQAPTVRFPPDDPDDDDDVITSRTYAKISDLIDRHNQSKVLLLMSLFMLWNQGLVCWYHAPKADRAFGMSHIENFKKGLTCEQCEDSKPIIPEDEEDLISGLHTCPTCGGPLVETTVLDSHQDSPKTRVIVETFGPLHVKISNWARTQKDTGYLIHALDYPSSFLKSLFLHIADKINPDRGGDSQYERNARSPSSYASYSREVESRGLCTFKRTWLRNWAFEDLPEDKEDEKKKLQAMFPNGCYVGFIGDTYAESRDEDLDKYWTICKGGLSTYIHSDAIGQPLISLQEMSNVLINLTLETVEQGMSTTFADPDVLDFGVYSRHEARPGFIYPARPRAGQTLNQNFYETNRATLSKEVGPFAQQLEKASQFVVGSFPSLYGGPGEGKSRTLGEYQQSRQQAMQRLTIPWNLLCVGWAKLKEKCVHLFVENMIDDERFAVPDTQQKGNYINVWIRKAELTGHVGEVEPEGADMFPVSTPQKQAIFFKLLELNNQFIQAAMFDPENRRMVADLTGFTDLDIPGEDQRIKQNSETAEMSKGVPINIEPLVDDHDIHANTLRHFMVSSRGLDLKRSQPEVYQLLSQHLQQHLDELAKAQQNAQNVQPPNTGGQ